MPIRLRYQKVKREAEKCRWLVKVNSVWKSKFHLYEKVEEKSENFSLFPGWCGRINVHFCINHWKMGMANKPLKFGCVKVNSTG